MRLEPFLTQKTIKACLSVTTSHLDDRQMLPFGSQRFHYIWHSPNPELHKENVLPIVWFKVIDCNWAKCEFCSLLKTQVITTHTSGLDIITVTQSLRAWGEFRYLNKHTVNLSVCTRTVTVFSQHCKSWEILSNTGPYVSSTLYLPKHC